MTFPLTITVENHGTPRPWRGLVRDARGEVVGVTPYDLDRSRARLRATRLARLLRLDFKFKGR